jgi:hypothetical protein
MAGRFFSERLGSAAADPAFETRLDECPFPTLADTYEISTR